MNCFRIVVFITTACLATGVWAQDAIEAPETTNSTLQVDSGSGLQITERSDQDRIELLLDVAGVYSDEKDYQSAIDAYERVLKIDPKNKQARFVVSTVYISAKQYAKAESAIKSLVEEFPEDYQLKNNLAWLYATAEDPKIRDGEKAISIAQEAMVIEPNDHHIWSTLAEAYYVTGQYEKAHRAITHMASLAARYGKGITPEMVDEYNEQIRRCKRAWDSEKALNGEEESERSDPDEEPAIDTSAAE